MGRDYRADHLIECAFKAYSRLRTLPCDLRAKKKSCGKPHNYSRFAPMYCASGRQKTISLPLFLSYMILINNQIIELVSARGRNHFREWLNTLPSSAAARVQARVYAAERGNLGDFKSVGDGVWEFRVHLKPGYRVYFGRMGNHTIILLCGGTKSSQQRDIQRAKRYWHDFKGDEDGSKKR
jgi:putative addiction module killer protein